MLMLWKFVISCDNLENVVVSTQRDNISETRDSRKAHFTRVTEVVESCQMCWISNGMQQVCNTNINDMCRTFSEKSGNVLS